MKTRAQRDSEQAYEQISEVMSQLTVEKQKAYGNRCHHFPMLVLRSGLCQAVAFYTVKANGKTHPETYKKFLEHMAAAAGESNTDHEAFQKRVLRMELTEYQQTTRRILAAAIWYKRFAVSLLDVEHGGDES